jgi:demethylmenaquinone methyltransferase/2-methoxy-6-polyprenyl-1,4-benzoquinol methylase
MARNTTLQPPPEHDRAIRDMFAGIAGVYDRLNGLLSLGRDAAWRRSLARAIDPSARDLLDACCGTGELILTARAMGRGTRHVAADFCLPMLQAGARDHALGAQAAVVAADTQRLPFCDASFDAAMVAFGLRNLGDLDCGLSELRRVLRPGGQLLVLEFFRARRRWVAVPLELYLRRGVPLLGKLAGGDGGAYGYLSCSMRRFLSLEEFCNSLQKNGLGSDMSTRPQTFGVAQLVVARRS